MAGVRQGLRQRARCARLVMRAWRAVRSSEEGCRALGTAGSGARGGSDWRGEG